MATRPRRTRKRVSAGSPSASSSSPGCEGHVPGTPGDLGHGIARAGRPAGGARRPARRSAVVIGLLPGDVASMTRTAPSLARMAAASSVRSMPTGHQAMQRPQPDAARGVELVPPRRQLVGEPLAVARRGGGPHGAAVQVGVVEIEARGPGALAPDLAGQVGGVGHVAAEAGRADQGAVPTGQAALGHLVPAGVVEVAAEQLGQTLRSRAGGRWRRRPSDRTRSRAARSPADGRGHGHTAEHVGTPFGADRGPRSGDRLRRRARSGPGRSRTRPRVRCPSTCRSRCRRGSRTRPPRRRCRPAGPRTGGRDRRPRAAPGPVRPGRPARRAGRR